MRKYVLILVLSYSLYTVAQTGSGDIEIYANAILDNAPGSTGNDYQEPTGSQLTSWGAMIDFLLSNELADARSSANSLNYQITEFTDISIVPNQIFYVLEERSPATNYWGTYIFSKTPSRDNLILQAPHSKFDTNTGSQAVYCFKNTVAKAVFLNGTHRCNSTIFSSCSGTTTTCGSSNSYKMSDLAHNITNMFQKTTEHMLSAISDAVFVQLHGFSKQASDPYVIMSNGTHEIPVIDYASLLKDALLIEDNSLTFELAHINTSWTRLIGFTNTQGRLINNSVNPCTMSATVSSGQFIHIEQEKSKLRDDVDDWMKMSNALSSVFTSTLSTNEYDVDNGFFVSPNPTSTDKVYVRGPNIDFIDVYSSLGQRVKRHENLGKSESIIINLESKISGVYFLRIQTPFGSISKKIIRL